MNKGLIEAGKTAGCQDKDIYALPMGRHHLVYAPLRRVMALINARALSVLNRWQETPADPPHAFRHMNDLIRRLDVVPCYPASPNGRLDPMFLGIIPTRECNLSCVYCNFGAEQSSGDGLDLHQACAAVEWMTDQTVQRGLCDLDIHFFGGEPFVAGDVIDVVVHRARASAARHGFIPRFEVATNGVFDHKRAQFVGDYFDTVVLSCDGFQSFHDRQRPLAGGNGSFKRVLQTAGRLAESAADLCVRICVTRENLDQLETFTRWFGETFRPAIINIETLKPTSGAQAGGLSPPDPFDFAMRCVSACRTIRKMGIEAVYVAADISTVKQSFCPVGKDAAILSPNGRISSCYLPETDWQARGLDLNIGRQDSSGKMDIQPAAVRRLRNLVMDKPRCRYCFCRWTCAGGCHVNETYPGCDPSYTDFCIQTRIITACFLMEQLGLSDKVDALLSDTDAMHRLAFNPQDTLGP